MWRKFSASAQLAWLNQRLKVQEAFLYLLQLKWDTYLLFARLRMDSGSVGFFFGCCPGKNGVFDVYMS